MSDFEDSDDDPFDDIIDYFSAKEWVSLSTVEKKSHRQTRLRYLACKSSGTIQQSFSLVKRYSLKHLSFFNAIWHKVSVTCIPLQV